MIHDLNLIKIGIIGAGEGGAFLIDILEENPEARIVGLAYRSEQREAVKMARRRNIRLFSDYKELAEWDEIDILIDVTGNPAVDDYLRKEKKSRSMLLSPLGSWLMWQLLEEQKRREREIALNLAEQEVLCSAGIMLASAANTQQTLDLIMESALSITGMSAGTLALYDEEQGIMQVKATLGFEQLNLPENYEWKVRPGGLTGHILSNNGPTVIEDLEADLGFDTTPLLGLGLKSLIASPMKVTGKIMGILYVDDFKKRKFAAREINVINLLSLQAAAAIDKALLLEKAELMATTDGLTKLYNHRYFVRALESEIKRSSRYKHETSLLMLDVDHFKVFNDTHGHLLGNAVLTNLADILRRSARNTDIVARYGGEEFVIILTQTDKDQAEEIAERIRSEVEATRFDGEEKQPMGTLTVSVGVATCPVDAKDPVGLIERSDRALYKSKELGRNKVTVCCP